jgi:hypothetical protein
MNKFVNNHIDGASAVYYISKNSGKNGKEKK